MKKLDAKKTIAKLLQGEISEKEREQLKEILKSDPALRNEFKKEIGFFMALKTADDIELEKVIDRYKFKPPPEREIER